MSDVEIPLEPGLTFYVRPREQHYIRPRSRYDQGYFTPSDRDMRRKSRMSVYVQNESVEENFVARRNRPVDEWRKILKERVLPRFGLPITGLRWEPYAYCSCPCSPAFVLPGWFGTEGPLSKQSWGTVDFAVNIDFALLGESSSSVLEPGDLARRAAMVSEMLMDSSVSIPAEILTA